jgi:isoaspartyl peptidase/L-asparaginase-like protein (Ntn-hydrolase superfamily)
MNLENMTPLQAARYSLKRILKIQGQAGVIIINRKGKFALAHTTEFMPSGYAGGEGKIIRGGFNRIGPLARLVSNFKSNDAGTEI